MNHVSNKTQYIINSIAPIRICDNGGWTDTWFARYGKVFNIAVSPYVEVQVRIFNPTTVNHDFSGKNSPKPQILLHVDNFGDNYVYREGQHWGKHPLIEATIEYMSLPKDTACEITIFSEVASGASMGTSAAVTVALIGALDCLKGGRLKSHEVANVAHKIETELLHQQSGIQDQLCSAYGGVNFIEIDRFPNATVETLSVTSEIWMELERRLLVVYLGRSHNSTQIHEMVIKSMEAAGPESKPLKDLRAMAEKSRDALYRGDFLSLGESMIQNTQAQSQLHPKLVSLDAEHIFDIAHKYGAIGWKVNGAGGDGGSVTILCDESSSQKRLMVAQMLKENSSIKIIPVRLSSHGLKVWTQKLS